MRFLLYVFLTFLLAGCGTKYEILPKTNGTSLSYEIAANAVNRQEFMLKRLPVNLKNRASNISFTYEFSYSNDKSSSQFDGLNLFNPLVIVGFPLSTDSFKMAGNLRFFSPKGELKISSICVSSTSKSLFKNTNFTLHYKDCIEKSDKI